MHEIVLTDRGLRDFKKLDHATRHHIGAKLRQFAQDPLAHARRLTNATIGTWRFRVGDYRVVFDIEGDTLVVLRVGHRRDIYR